ncbi:hypothetical protein LMH73_006230 [Vibrio splendidus]|nr:hypothetical protein [Vibrio splendidus]MCC4880750.1 hypothetical protein [Vibrio splendidus]
MAYSPSRLRFLMASGLLLGFSSPAFAFPILTTTAAIYLTPLLVAFLSGGVALYSRRSRRIALTITSLAIGFFVISGSIDNKIDNSPQKQKYDYNFERSDMNMSVFMPRSALLDMMAQTDDFYHIKVQDVREVLFDVKDTFGFSEHAKAIDAINASGKSLVFISSFSNGSSLTFAEKIKGKVNAKIYLVRSGVPVDFCKVGNCDKTPTVIPFDASEVSLYKRFSERGSHILKDYNIITSRSENTYTELYRKEMIYIDSDLVITRDDAYWSEVKSLLDPKKKVLLGVNLGLEYEQDITSEQKNQIEQSYIRLIANKLGIDTLYYTTSIESIRMISFKSNDTIVTPYFKGDTTYVSPFRTLIKREKSPDYYRTLCFTNECVDTFGRDIAYNIANTGAVTFNGKVNINIDEIKKLNGIDGGRILVASHDTHSSMLARLTAYELVQNDMDFAGFTEHHSRYYGNSRTFYYFGEYDFVYDDLWLEPLLNGLALLDIDAMDVEFEIDMIVLAVICIAFGLLSGVNGIATSSSIAFVIFCLGLARFAYLPFEYMEKELIIVPVSAILIGVFFWLKLRSIKFVVLGCSIILVPFYLGMTDTLSNHAIAFYLIGGIASCVLLKRDRLHVFNGDKYALTSKYVPIHKRGRVVSSLEDAKRMVVNGQHLLRSNHLSSKEHGMSGYFDSYLVDSLTIDEVWARAVKSLETEGLKPSDIQFWLMPQLSFSQKGVMSSLGQNPCLIGVSMGDNDDVTEGVSSGYRELPRSRAEAKRFAEQFSATNIEMKLVDVIKSIEASEGMPVVVEFGVGRFGKITILQVRHQESELSNAVVESILLGRYQVVSLDSFTAIGTNAIRMITDSMVLCSASGMAVTSKMLTSNTRQVLAPHNLYSVTQKLLALDFNPTKSLQSRINTVSSILKPIIMVYFAGGSDLTRTASSELQDTVDACLAIIGDEHIQEYDIGKDLLKAPSSTVLANSLTVKDVLRLILDASLKRIKVTMSESCDLARERYVGSSVEQFDNQHFIAAVEGGVSSGVIIVHDGDFSGKKVSLSEFMVLDEAKRENIVIEDDYIPVPLMSDAMKAKAIILRKGSPLSHVAMTAKSIRKPMKFTY